MATATSQQQQGSQQQQLQHPPKRSRATTPSPRPGATVVVVAPPPPPPHPHQRQQQQQHHQHSVQAPPSGAMTTSAATAGGAERQRRAADLEADSEWHRAGPQPTSPHHPGGIGDDEAAAELLARKALRQHQQQVQQTSLLAPPPSASSSAIFDGATATVGSSASRRSRAPTAHANMADRHSCLAAPYSPTDPRTLRYFELVISKAKAPVVCASAGKLKGKAIFADRDIEQAARIWTEAPFVAMQHEQNRAHVRCCQYCFVPLLSDYRARWRDMATRWNRARAGPGGEPPVGDDELDRALQQLEVNRANCGLAGAGAACSCGEVYCSKLCQLRAFHEFHAVLCPREDAYSAMSQFLAHMRHTNDIFFLAAKVVARLLSRYVQSRDVLKAREPMDMFHKKPWWEVVMMEKQLARVDGDARAPTAATATTTATNNNNNINTVGAPGTNGTNGTTATNANTINSSEALSAHLDEMNGGGGAGGGPGGDDDGLQAHCLRELLTYTHQLLLDAIECNLVRLEREDQLRGLSVDDVWSACASILSFEFFAAQLGLFEMNNVSMEIDHPFRGLIEILDPDVHADTDDERDARRADRDSVVARVRRVLEHEEALLAAAQRDDGGSGDEHALPLAGGFLGVEGTALFPIICTMNHSCDPNCTVLYTKDGRAHVVAVRDIKKGDELCICYIDIDADVRTREANLREYQFKCFCARCSDERRALALSPTPRSARAGDAARPR